LRCAAAHSPLSVSYPISKLAWNSFVVILMWNWFIAVLEPWIICTSLGNKYHNLGSAVWLPEQFSFLMSSTGTWSVEIVCAVWILDDV
jgi:hypothetical protein